MKGTDGNAHRHTGPQLSDLGLVDVAAENQVIHVGHGGDCRTVVEGVAQNDGVAHFHGNIEDQTADGTSDKRAAGTGIAAGYAIAHDFQIVGGSFHLLSALVVGLERLLVFLTAHQALVIKDLLPLIVGLGLSDIDLGKANTGLSGTELVHVGDDLHLGDDFTLRDLVAGLFENFRDDARDLWLHADFVARLYLAGHNGGLADVAHLWLELFIDIGLGL